MGKAIKNVFKTDTLTLTQCTNGYYLWDNVAGINIAIHAENEQQALIDGLDYYQKYYYKLKEKYEKLNDNMKKLSEFLSNSE